MPARIVIALGTTDVGKHVAEDLARNGFDVLEVDSSMAALDVLEQARRLEVLITRADFGPNQPNGVALVRMARIKRPDIRALFIGDPSVAPHMEGLGAFLALPAKAADIVRRTIELLTEAPLPCNKVASHQRSRTSPKLGSESDVTTSRQTRSRP